MKIKVKIGDARIKKTSWVLTIEVIEQVLDDDHLIITYIDYFYSDKSQIISKATISRSTWETKITGQKYLYYSTE